MCVWCGVAPSRTGRRVESPWTGLPDSSGRSLRTSLDPYTEVPTALAENRHQSRPKRPSASGTVRLTSAKGAASEVSYSADHGEPATAHFAAVCDEVPAG